jgi:hypothetical protein
VNVESQITTEGVVDSLDNVEEGGVNREDDYLDDLVSPTTQRTNSTCMSEPLISWSAVPSPPTTTLLEAIYMVEALTLVKSMKTMRTPEVAQRLQEQYNGFIREIPLTHFADASIKVKIEEKDFHAKGSSADGLLMKANKVLKYVCVLAAGIRGVSMPLHQIPSGKSLTAMRNEFILKKWNTAQETVYVPSNNIDELMSEVPDGWWILNTTNHLLLAVLVYRMNPDIVSNPTIAPAGPNRDISRAEACYDTVKSREMERIVANHDTKCQRVEDSMIVLKAQLMAQINDSATIDKSRNSFHS